MSLVMLEICLVKNLQIHKYRLTASFSDEFWFQFFVAFNGVVASFLTLVDQKLSNLPDYDILSKNLLIVTYKFLPGISQMVMLSEFIGLIVTLIHFLFRKWKTNQVILPEVSKAEKAIFNTSHYNESLMSTLQILISLLAFILPRIIMFAFDPTYSTPFLPTHAGLVLPLLFYSFNSQLRRHVKYEFLSWQ